MFAKFPLRNHFNESEIMKFAIIGAGRMGRRHMHAVRKLGYSVMGVVDKSRSSLDEAKQEHNLKENMLFATPEEMFAVDVPTCLIIATTAESHCALTCMAAERGVKYILVEKPLAVSLEECDRMIHTCEQYGARLTVNHQMRFMEQYFKPKELLDSEVYGGFRSMTVVGGNFGMSMNGTHYLEAFRYLSGEDPLEVMAWFDPGKVANPRGEKFEDRAGSLRVTTASGKRLYIEIGAEQGHGLEVIYAGRNGLISVSELIGSMTAAVRQPEYRALPTTRYGMPADLTQHTIAPVEVIDSTALVINALICDENRVTAEQAIKAVEVLVAAYESAENGGRAVRIDSQLDRCRVFPWA
jgi:predicted dehydrogenase